MNKYTLLSFLFLFAHTALLRAQTFHNLDFQQTCDTSKTGLCYWDLSWGKQGSVSTAVIEGEKCLLMSGKLENSVSFVEQSVSFPSDVNYVIITIQASIQSDSIEGKGAGLNIGVYDKDGNYLATRDMGGFYSIDWIKGKQKWKDYAISVVCPPATSYVKVGMILFGSGKAWFKDFSVTMAPLIDREPSQLAIQYITAACDTIKTHSLVRDSIPLNDIKAVALQIAGPAKTYSDCHPAVTYLLESLRPYGDQHSFLMTARELENWKDEGSQVSAIQFSTFSIWDSCGYIAVPPFHGGNPKQILAFADSLQSAISFLYQQGIKGWIVDLRLNTGGNMAPMLAGLGPLFSSAKLGSLVDVTGEFNAWHYEDGKYFWDDDEGWSVSNPVQLPTQLPVAVLTGFQTGSSGEAVVISFKGNARTRSFGQPTWGLTTGNGSYDLPDGSQIFLASTIMADRNDILYHDRVIPDEFLELKETDKWDIVIYGAIDWIKAQR